MILQFELPHPASKVIEYLSDPVKFTKVHPLIEKMELIEKGRYRVFEKVKFGPFPYSFTYVAAIDQDLEDGKVHMKISIKIGTRISFTFKVSPISDGCRVEEMVKMQSLLPIRGYMKKLISGQHKILFENIKHELYGEK
jgi:carbon monoxide dehydrogenase subunit G